MKAVVVYESLWGSTAAVARAIAEGIGNGTQALDTDAATADVLVGVDLVVVGAPIHGFQLPTEGGRTNLGMQEAKAPSPPDVSHPTLRTWLEGMPKGSGRAAAFETGFRWSPGSATRGALKRLGKSGYQCAHRGERFLVAGTYGPMRDGELERARAWGERLAAEIG